MQKTKIIIDLNTAALLGPMCKIFEFLAGYKKLGYKVKIINKNWTVQAGLGTGTTFDKSSGKYEYGSSRYLWDPNTHPRDLLHNLILPTFDNITLVDLPANRLNFFEKVKKYYSFALDKNNLTYFDYGYKFLEKEDAKIAKKERDVEILKQKTVRKWFEIVFFQYQFFISRKSKIYPKSMGFRYQLSNKSYQKNVVDFIKKHKKVKKKYILISILWDESKVFEKQDDRLRGGPLFNEKEWLRLLAYIRTLDNYALETGKIGFILASKKAVDWSKYLRSDFIDLRNFEELGFSLAQSIYIIQELASATLNWPSTFSTWITNCSDIIHLTWMSNKDTSKWSRNDFHKKPPRELLKLIIK